MRLVACLFAAFALLSSAAHAQTDEIQVYTGGLAEPGVVNLTVHTNFVASGIKDPAFPGAVVANHSLNGVPEWALGVTEWFEAGLYLPLYSHDSHSGWGLDGFKLRALFAVPHADDRKFFYGSNFEFSINANRWEGKRYSSEVRPIIGWHLGTVDIIVNPILDTSYDGLKNLDFAPAARVALKAGSSSQIAIEEYDDFGPLHALYGGHDQVHQVYGVYDRSLPNGLDIEAGVGFGLTSASDNLTFKLILSRDLNPKSKPKP